MKRLLLSATLSLLASTTTNAAIVVPGANGTDGALNITQDTVIDLSKATTGTWDQDNSANSGNGVYDPAKWAVVFKYTSVNVLAGKKLTFKNHATRAPVVWLVSGNVAISGTVDLSGEGTVGDGFLFNQDLYPLGGRLAEPGPGGFRGGAGWRGGNIAPGPGFGPGGGRSVGTDTWSGWYLAGTGGAYASTISGSLNGPEAKKYGNPSLLPLIGGSGGSGSFSWSLQPVIGLGGGGGGGAILIAAKGRVALDFGSEIRSVGGKTGGYSASAGSGGGIRLVCEELSGRGLINAAGGSAASSGRIRLERVLNDGELTVIPAPSTIDLPIGDSAMIWPPSDGPTPSPEARIVSIGGAASPPDPKAAFGAHSPDISLPLVSSVSVIVESLNAETASEVIVRVSPRNGDLTKVPALAKNDAIEVTATIKQVISEKPLKIHWEATVPTLPGHSAIQARIVRP